MKKVELICDKNDIKLEKFLLSKLPDLSFSKFRRALIDKNIKVNNIRVRQNILLSHNDNVSIYYNPNELTKPDIVYQDDNILVANKPVGMITTTIDNHEIGNTLEDSLGAIACHRLDRNTSGLVLMAKNNEYFNIISKEIANGNIDKFYTCLVSGKMPKKSDTLRAYLEKFSDESIVKIYNRPHDKAVKIITKYSVIRDIASNQLLNIQLLTGKTHQIRAHLAFVGHHIIGDNKYGKKEVNKYYKAKYQLLTATKLKFNFRDSKLIYLNDLNVEIFPEWIKSLEKYE